MPGIIVELDDGKTFEIPKSTVADEIAFERKFGLSAARLASDPHLEWLAFIVWNQIKRKGTEVPEFDDFVNQIQDLRVEVEEGKAGPKSTSEVAPTDSSPA